MRIGDFARLTGTPARSLRYYEEQGLLSPGRTENGYRDYEPELIDRAMQIRGLIDSGVSTSAIAHILPRLQARESLLPAEASAELLRVLRDEHRKMTERIDILTRHRDALSLYLAAADGATDGPR